MAKLREGQQVVFNFKGTNKIGTIERIRMIDKMKRYQVRDEGGKLYPYLGINTKEPGKIDVTLTKAYFDAKKEETQESVLIGSEGDFDNEETSGK
jgi:hypothetical protein